ncbi:hypothetical protein IC582_031620 [Cucumis melo]
MDLPGPIHDFLVVLLGSGLILGSMGVLLFNNSIYSAFSVQNIPKILIFGPWEWNTSWYGIIWTTRSNQILEQDLISNSQQLEFISTYFFLPFELISIILLAALIGAISVARHWSIMLEHVLIISAYLFSIGIYGLITSRNMVRALMCLELILNAVNMNFVTFSDFFDSRQLKGNIFSIFVIAIAAAEAAIGPAILSSIYRNRKSTRINQSNLLNK